MRMLVNFMQRKNLAVDDVSLLPPGGGYLLVEMGAWNAGEARADGREAGAGLAKLAGQTGGAYL